MKANSTQSIAGASLNAATPPSAKAIDNPIMTGTAAPASVFGRAASNQAMGEPAIICFSSFIIPLLDFLLAKVNI